MIMNKIRNYQMVNQGTVRSQIIIKMYEMNCKLDRLGIRRLSYIEFVATEGLDHIAWSSEDDKSYLTVWKRYLSYLRIVYMEFIANASNA